MRNSIVRQFKQTFGKSFTNSDAFHIKSRPLSMKRDQLWSYYNIAKHRCKG